MIAHRVVLGLTLCALAVPAFAHARLIGQSPSAGAALPSSPAEVRLSFSELLDPVGSDLSVTDPAGHGFADGAPRIGNDTMVLKLRPLPEGTYHVEWHAVSVDAHRTEGGYDFTVMP